VGTKTQRAGLRDDRTTQREKATEGHRGLLNSNGQIGSGYIVVEKIIDRASIIVIIKMS
jgi:hypothetical protein